VKGTRIESASRVVRVRRYAKFVKRHKALNNRRLPLSPMDARMADFDLGYEKGYRKGYKAGKKAGGNKKPK